MWSLWIVFCFCLVAAYFDWRTCKIPNRVTGSLIVTAFIIQLWNGQWGKGLFAMAVVFLIGFTLFLFRQLGAGDVKLFMGIAMATDLYTVFLVFAFAVCAAGIYVLIRTLATKQVILVMYILYSLGLSGFFLRQWNTDQLDGFKRDAVPFGPMIAFGVLCAIFVIILK